MSNVATLSPLLSLRQVIDTNPLQVTPETDLQKAIALMGRTYSSVPFWDTDIPAESSFVSKARASCVLVIEDDELLGLFTARDATRILAEGQDLAWVSVGSVMTQEVITHSSENWETEDIFQPFDLLRRHSLRYLPILDGEGKVQGLVTPESIRQGLKLTRLLEKCPLANDLLESAPQVTPETVLIDAAKVMSEHRSCCVAVTQAGVLQGMVTVEDVVQLHTLEIDLKTKPVAAVMREERFVVQPSHDLSAVHNQMLRSHLRQLPVCNHGGELAGVITLDELLAVLTPPQLYQAIETLRERLEQLEQERSLWLEQEDQLDLEQEVADYATSLRWQLERDRVMNRISLSIRRNLEMTEAFQLIVDEARSLFNCDRVVIYRFNEDGSGIIDTEAVVTDYPSILGKRIFDSFFARVYSEPYREGRIQAEGDIYEADLTQCHIDLLAQFQIRAVLVVPILAGDQLWGLLCAHHCRAPRPWRTKEITVFQRLAVQLSIIIQQHQIYEGQKKAQQLNEEMRQALEQKQLMQVSLRQKELLLKEVHHRVKNNLQIVSSLLKLQANAVLDPQVSQMLSQSQNKIYAMALVHQQLHQSGSLEAIDFQVYLAELIKQLQNTLINDTEIHISLDLDAAELSLDLVTPCGLIVNELVTNAVKHAFPQQKEGIIKIEFSKQPDHFYQLQVQDNGIGLPPAMQDNVPHTLGFKIIRALTKQIRGKLNTQSSSEGTTVTLTFADYLPKSK